MKNTTDTRQLLTINRIVEPWLPVNTDRTAWTVTLRSGKQVTICCPLGAAVEIEEAGHTVTAQR